MDPAPPAQIDQAAVLEALQRRYDHTSARTILAEALQAAGVAEAPVYTLAEVSRLAWTLHGLGQRVQPAATALLELVAAAAAPDGPVDPEDEDALDVEVATAEVPALIQQVVAAAVAVVREQRQPRQPSQSQRPLAAGAEEERC